MQEKKEIIYSELSYKIIGIAYKVFNLLQYGHQEKYYQRALELELKKEKIKYEKEKEVALNYNGSKIGKYYLDFLIEDKIIVELKILSVYRYKNIRQVLEYLKETNKKLAILIYFTQEGVKYRRVINPRFNLF
ncbi:GxxExxY protein [Patescibacteria group bacterium]|nr:GxxExxY protein [Patescibacteria group bacterium]MBU4143021.1 GxxExxY protein [Patescibacteria group bacterium]